MNNEKVLFIGPVPPPFTGQSIAFDVVAGNLAEDQSYILDPFLPGKSGLAALVKGYWTLLCFLIFRPYKGIYITCSRSKKGALKDVLILFVARLRRKNVVIHLHGADFKPFFYSLKNPYRSLLAAAYRTVSEFIVLTDRMRDQFEMFPKARVAVIPNSYQRELDKLPLVKKNNDVLRVLYLSNIIYSKGIFDLLDSAEKLIRDGIPFILDIAGIFFEDDYIPSKNEVADRFNNRCTAINELRPGTIIFHGPLGMAEKKRLLEQADIFVLPTFYKTEAFPLSILEAMRSGLFIITSDFNYLPDIVTEKNGRLISPQSPDQIFEVIKDLNTDRMRLNEVCCFNISYAISSFQESEFLAKVSSVINRSIP